MCPIVLIASFFLAMTLSFKKVIHFCMYHNFTENGFTSFYDENEWHYICWFIALSVIFIQLCASLMKKTCLDFRHERRDAEADRQIDVCSQVVPIPHTGLMLEQNTKGGRERERCRGRGRERYSCLSLNMFSAIRLFWYNSHARLCFTGIAMYFSENLIDIFAWTWIPITSGDKCFKMQKSLTSVSIKQNICFNCCVWIENHITEFLVIGCIPNS